MNILPKKKWHVRTKENMARVRRDEAKAAAEEKARLERSRLAEHEDRMNRLRRNTADVEVEDPFAHRPSTSENQSAVGHVNFFAELEEQERKNLTSGGNKEYQAEKKREQHEWESKMGIMKRFAEDTKELNRESNWWEGIDRSTKSESKREGDAETKKQKTEKELRRELKKQLKEERRRKKAKKRRRRSSTSSSGSDSEKTRAKQQKLELLRKERLERELAEQRRVQELVGGAPVKTKKEPTYSNQFNPDLVRRR